VPTPSTFSNRVLPARPPPVSVPNFAPVSEIFPSATFSSIAFRKACFIFACSSGVGARYLLRKRATGSSPFTTRSHFSVTESLNAYSIFRPMISRLPLRGPGQEYSHLLSRFVPVSCSTSAGISGISARTISSGSSAQRSSAYLPSFDDPPEADADPPLPPLSAEDESSSQATSRPAARSITPVTRSPGIHRHFTECIPTVEFPFFIVPRGEDEGAVAGESRIAPLGTHLHGSARRRVSGGGGSDKLVRFTDPGDRMPLDLEPAYTVDLVTGDPEGKREEIRAYFHATCDIHERLYETVVDDDAFYRRADPLRHPLIFYLGHTAVFFVNKLVLARIIPRRINPGFESIFAVGVDEMSWDDLNEAHYDWPTVEDTREYRDRVRELVTEVIRTQPLSMPIGWDSPFWAIMMGIEHERIHLETSSVLIRQLPLECVRPHPFFQICEESGEAPGNELLDVPGGRVVLGKGFDDRFYGWDNEYGRLEQDVASFRASRFLVSNAEFREFVDAGGYREPDYWDEEGRAWRSFREAECPLFWIAAGDGGGWRLRLMLEEVPMRWDWPVEVNCLEARAFCAWKTAREGRTTRLPSEEEWYRLRAVSGVPDVPEWDGAPGNLNLEHSASPCPVDRFESGGFCDVVGNVWQWTETPITGFPGFRVHPLYDDFSTPTFDLRHNLIKGGSWISTGNEAIRDSRYAFRRHFYQHAGFRYIESEAPVKVRRDVYEADELVAQYCEFHWGEDYFGERNFPAECARVCLELTEGGRRERALDLGCAVGRATFELARGFEHVTGLDFSARFIRIADDMEKKGYIQYVLPDEGELVSYHEKKLADFGLAGAEGRVEFLQADACNLKPLHTDYDLVFAGNLIDRLYRPGKFLRTIHERIRPGGWLVLTSPYTWLTEHTDREEWIGGVKRDGENVTTLDGLDEILGAQFVRRGEPREITFVIRETKRKFQHTISELTVWERR